MPNLIDFLNGDVKRVILTCWSFVVINAACELGEAVTHQFNSFEAAFGQSDWYLYPSKLQRLHLMLLKNVQQHMSINGFANTVCTRDFMKKVISVHNSVK